MKVPYIVSKFGAKWISGTTNLWTIARGRTPNSPFGFGWSAAAVENKLQSTQIRVKLGVGNPQIAANGFHPL